MRRLLVLAILLVPGALAADVRMHDDGQGGGAAYRFEPTRVEVAAGGPLRVINEGQDVHTFSHDVEPSQRLFDETMVEPGGARDLPAPNLPGEYPFKCAYHPEMTGVLVVEAREPPGGVTPTSGASPTEGRGFDAGERAPSPFQPEESIPGPALPLVLAMAALAALALRRR